MTGPEGLGRNTMWVLLNSSVGLGHVTAGIIRMTDETGDNDDDDGDYDDNDDDDDRMRSWVEHHVGVVEHPCRVGARHRWTQQTNQ